jgi:hypothetical protein
MSNNNEEKKVRNKAMSVVKAYIDEKSGSSNHNSFMKISHPKKTKNKYSSNLTIECINKSNEKNYNKIYGLTNVKKESDQPKKLLSTFGLNTSFNLSNVNTQINSSTINNLTQIKKKSLFCNTLTNNLMNVKIPNAIQPVNVVNNNNNNNILNNSIKLARRKNTISYVDRKKIKKLNTTTLKLYEIYLQRKNQALKDEDSLSNKDTLFNKKSNYIINNLDTINSNSFLRSNKNISINSSSSISRDYSSKNNKFKKQFKQFKTERKYGLKQLMKLNPYHYVSSMVKYCNSIEMKNISEKLSTVNGAMFNRKATSKQLFFKNENYNNNKRVNKVIDSCCVSYTNNLSLKGGLVWRILAKITKTTGFSSFYNACKFKGYFELWKHYSILIEQLLVKYIEFKWFLEKTKFMKEEVFKEFLTCVKIELKNDNTFSNKVILLFDDNCKGEMNIKVFFFIMELTSKSSSDIEKINFYTELFSELNLRNQPNCISVLETYDIIKHIINSPSHKRECKYLYEMLKQTFHDGEKIDENVYITKKDLYYFFLNNKFLQKLIQSFLYQYNHADLIYDEEIKNSFNSTVRTVKKFLNEQNEVTKMTINECDKLEKVLKSVKNKEISKNQIKMYINEFQNDDDAHNEGNSEDL